jgi:hypothetical protein
MKISEALALTWEEIAENFEKSAKSWADRWPNDDRLYMQTLTDKLRTVQELIEKGGYVILGPRQWTIQIGKNAVHSGYYGLDIETGNRYTLRHSPILQWALKYGLPVLDRTHVDSIGLDLPLAKLPEFCPADWYDNIHPLSYAPFQYVFTKWVQRGAIWYNCPDADLNPSVGITGDMVDVFAECHGLKAGDSVDAVLADGTRRRFGRILGFSTTDNHFCYIVGYGTKTKNKIHIAKRWQDGAYYIRLFNVARIEKSTL